MAVFGRRTLTLDSPTFAELKSAGRLTVVSDTVLRSRLMTYFNNLARTERITEKNNDFFVEPFTAFLRETGIGFVPSPKERCDDDYTTILCIYSNLVLSVSEGQKTHGVDQVLAVPASDPIWSKLRSHVTFRTVAAISNGRTVEAALKETREIHALLEATL